MYINISLLEDYILRNGMNVTTSIDIEDNEAMLKFTLGKDKEGSRVEFLAFNQLYEILVVNNMLGEDGLVIKERDTPQEEMLQRERSRQDKSKNIDDLIYHTLAKYILQMMNAGVGRVLFPEIIPLPNHKSVYFREY